MSEIVTIPELHRSHLAREGEPCSNCRALMAGDQRYCLNCGTRRGPSRVPMPQTAVPALSAPVGVQVPRPIPRRSWLSGFSPQLVGLVSGIAAAMVLGLGFVAGALIARKNTPAPVVATPVATAAAATPPPTPVPTVAAPTATPETTVAPDPTETPTPEATATATPSSPEEAQKNTKKAPPTVNSQGKKVEKDHKKPGAGSDSTEIG